MILISDDKDQMLAGREDHITKLGKTKLINVEKYLISMVVLKKYSWGSVKKTPFARCSND